MKKIALIGFILIITAWLNTNLFVYPFTLLERQLGNLAGKIKPVSAESCGATVAAHRGFSKRGKYADASVPALKAAIEAGVKHIEVDLTINDEEVFLRHDDFTADDLKNPALLKQHYPDLLTLAEFLERYALAFENVVLDIKSIHPDRSTALRLLTNHSWPGQNKFFFIGRSCNLLKQLQSRLGIPAGCEAQGVLGNWMMGLDLWSVDYRDANQLQIWLNSYIKLRLLLWTFPTATESRKYCHYNPEIVLVSDVFM